MLRFTKLDGIQSLVCTVAGPVDFKHKCVKILTTNFISNEK